MRECPVCHGDFDDLEKFPDGCKACGNSGLDCSHPVKSEPEDESEPNRLRQSD